MVRLFGLLFVASVAYTPVRRRMSCPAAVDVRMRRVSLHATSRDARDGAGAVGALLRYPIKGFPADSLESVTVEANGTFPSDRLYAVVDATDDGGWDAARPRWVHKQHFFGAFRSRDVLASLNTSCRAGVLAFDGGPETGLSARLDTAAGRATVEAAIAARVQSPQVRLVTGGEGHQFGNTRSGVKSHGDTRTIHLVNAASVAAVRAATGLDVDASVFRPNVVLEGLDAWAEEAWVGKQLRLGGALLEVISRTVRCDAINMHPRTGARWPGNRDLVAEIAGNFPAVGPYLGVYARVLRGGTVSLGDDAAVIAS